MYKKCPQCGYIRRSTDTAAANTCPACGIDFKQWLKQQLQSARQAEVGDTFEAIRHEEQLGLLSTLKEILLYVPSHTDSTVFYARVVTYLVFFIWGWQFIFMTIESNEIGSSFLHYVNLVFHEAGHVIFRLLGDFMAVLGGTLGQLLMPLIVTMSLIVKNQDNFGASLGLWWLAQSLMDCAPYINDARAGELMLLGGFTGKDAPPGYHDWENILGRLDLLAYDHVIANIFDGMGTLLMLIAFVWGAVILHLQFKYR